MRYWQAPEGWSPPDPNLFTSDGQYGADWSCFCVVDRRGITLSTGRDANGLWVARLDRDVEYLNHRLADLLRYETKHGRRVILSFPAGVEVDSTVEMALSDTPAAHIIRPTDPRTVVHSTSLAGWESIRREGMLKASANRAPPPDAAPSHGAAPSEIECYQMNEPKEYAGYIVFGEMGSPWPELIVLSKMRGSFCTDANAPYEPGIRLYVDNHRIIRSKLGVRDGLHLMKVFDHLPLDPFMIAAIGVGDIDGVGNSQEWTPARFVEQADLAFSDRFGSWR